MIKKLIFNDITIKNNLMTAPVAGYSDIPYRKVMEKLGPGLIFTEMISIEALARENRKTLNMLENAKGKEDILCVQLFGNNIDSYTKAIEIVQDRLNFKIINLNMGCPVKKVIKSRAGCFYLTDLEEAKKVIKHVRKKVKGVFNIKTRIGIRHGDDIGLKLCKIAEDEGVDFVSVHGRTFNQFFKGEICYDSIAEIKANINIPLIANGDIKNKDLADKMFERTNCDGIMIGRGSYGNPGIFWNILDKNKYIDEKNFFLDHLKETIEYYGEDAGFRSFKKFIPYYKELFTKEEKIALLTSLRYDEFINKIKSLRCMR